MSSLRRMPGVYSPPVNNGGIASASSARQPMGATTP
jgi:hypothetical protein